MCLLRLRHFVVRSLTSHAPPLSWRTVKHFQSGIRRSASSSCRVHAARTAYNFAMGTGDCCGLVSWNYYGNTPVQFFDNVRICKARVRENSIKCQGLSARKMISLHSMLVAVLSLENAFFRLRIVTSSAGCAGKSSSSSSQIRYHLSNFGFEK